MGAADVGYLIISTIVFRNKKRFEFVFIYQLGNEKKEKRTHKHFILFFIIK